MHTFTFLGCNNITTINIGENVKTIATSAFSYCSGLTTVNFNAENCTTMGSEKSSLFAFKNLTTINIGDNVKTIPRYAFNGCTGLTEINIPNSVTVIGDWAFYNCSGLTEVTIPSSVTSIGSKAFWECRNMTSITIPNSVTSIGWRAFYKCTGVTEIHVEEGNITYDSRENCNALIETASNTLILGCSNTVIPNSVTSFGDDAFSYCKGLTSVTIGNSVTSIGNYAFSNCTGLTEITIPNSVTSIGNYTFWCCSGLTEITIPNSVTSIGESVFSRCEGLTSITIPNSVTSIGSSAFSNCTGLTEITIPNSVTSIGGYAFSNCTSLTSVTIPNGVTSIGDYAFNYCTGLKEICVEATTPPAIQSFTFSEVDKSIPVYVPAGCEETYRSADYWSWFTNIQAITVSDEIATSLTLDNEELEMYIGEAVQLSATVLPDNTTNKLVTWTSSDEEVATVDENGNVTAVSIGTATITATTTDGSNLSATCEVTVEQKMVKLIMQNSYYNTVELFLLPGTEQKMRILAVDNYYVLNSVVLNGKNVTEEVVDGIYTTPALMEDAVLNISFSIPTAEDTPSVNSRIKAYGYRGDVVVTGCERGESIAIYDVDGVLLRTMYATGNVMRIAMPTDAIYVVKAADAAVKVAL